MLRSACQHKLGQADRLVTDVARRREAMLDALAARPRPWHFIRLRAEPEWRLAVGLGNGANAHEIGLALHGTYGWPVIPGSALKGLAAAWAASSGGIDADVTAGSLALPVATFQPPRSTQPGQRAGRCASSMPSRRASPSPSKPTCSPRTSSPTTTARRRGRRVLLAEYHNPVPLTFLTVRGTYAVDLYGPVSEDIGLAAEWLAKAGDELGVGAKTAAGYGYLSVDQEPRDPRT